SRQSFLALDGPSASGHVFRGPGWTVPPGADLYGRAEPPLADHQGPAVWTVRRDQGSERAPRADDARPRNSQDQATHARPREADAGCTASRRPRNRDEACAHEPGD